MRGASASGAERGGAGPGGGPATIEGGCRMEPDCGCLEHGTVEGCVAGLTASASVMTPDVSTCIADESCGAM